MQVLYYHLSDLNEIPMGFYGEFYSAINDHERIDTSKNHLRPEYQSRTLIGTAYHSPQTSTRSQRFDTSSEFKSWIKKNITDQWTECSISITENSLGNIHGAHTDWSRHWVMIYVIEPGGDQCETTWYQEHDKPVLREDLGCYITDYSKISNIGSVKMLSNQWYVINSQILHGVNNIDKDRITIQIGLWNLDSIKSKLIKGK